MEDFFAACGHLYELAEVPLAVCDGEGRYLASWPALAPDTIRAEVVRMLLQDFQLQGRDEAHPLIHYGEPGFFSGVARLGPDRYCLAGPAGPLSHSRQEVVAFCAPAVEPPRLQEYCTLLMNTPLTTLSRMRSLVCLLVRLAGGPAVEPEQVLLCDNTALGPRGSRALQQELFQNREEILPHVPGAFESAICDAVAQGSMETLARRLTVPDAGRNGRMSADALRQTKYTFVGFVTLVTRAAVRGGLPVETAYSLSDVYCQRMDGLADPEQVNRLLYTCVVDFCQRVAQVREGAGRSVLVRSCLEYITLHLHEPLRLEDLAVRCGVSVRTLTARFRREMGMSLNAYIHTERTREACYLLEHTDHSLADVAFFLNYPSQSYFTQVFRRYQGCTPAQYRSRPGGPR